MANPVFVQQNSSDPNTSSATRTCIYSSAQTAGNTNVVMIAYLGGAGTINTPTDTKLNTYTLLTNVALASTNLIWMYTAPNIAVATAGANTVSVTASSGAAAAWCIGILEYGGVLTASVTDGAGAVGSNAGSAGPATTGNLVTTNAADMLISCCACQSGAPTGAGTGFTQRFLTGALGFLAQDRLVTSTGTYTATAPLNSTTDWTILLGALKGTGGATVAPSLLANPKLVYP